MCQELNRYGECPKCKASWDGGDILEQLSKMEVFINKTYAEMVEVANIYYGWTEENKKRFSKLINRQGVSWNYFLWQCPSCMALFNDTGKSFSTLNEAINHKYE